MYDTRFTAIAHKGARSEPSMPPRNRPRRWRNIPDTGAYSCRRHVPRGLQAARKAGVATARGWRGNTMRFRWSACMFAASFSICSGIGVRRAPSLRHEQGARNCVGFGRLELSRPPCPQPGTDEGCGRTPDTRLRRHELTRKQMRRTPRAKSLGDVEPQVEALQRLVLPLPEPKSRAGCRGTPRRAAPGQLTSVLPRGNRAAAPESPRRRASSSAA